MPRFSGNKGEWGELYALCKLLGDGRLYNADADLSKNESQNVEIRAIHRPESEDRTLEYRVDADDRLIRVFLNGQLLRTLPQQLFIDTSKNMLEILRNRKGAAFEIPELDEFIDAIGVTRLKPSGTEKPDIFVDIFDSRTASEYTVSYSIKSFIGAKPSLVNSSALTYFFYELIGFTDEDYEAAIQIPAKKVKQRVKICRELADEVRYSHLSPGATTFHENLMRVHPYAEAVLGSLVLESYAVRGKHSADVLANVTTSNPLHYENPHFYEDAYREYLWAAFFGMHPSKPWDRRDSVDGFLLITSAGEALSYLVAKRNTFSDHLLEASSFDTPSTAADRPTCDTGAIFQQDGKYYLALNLQIKYQGKLKLSQKQEIRFGTIDLSQEASMSASCETGQADPIEDQPVPRFRIVS